tara:strand:+ start:64 stop:633 length:570 start_codon:yes stop_codon:yes gene_type:complete
MTRISIDIPKSKNAERLITRQWLINKLLDYLLPLMIVGMFLFITIMEFKSDFKNNQSIALSLTLLILTTTIAVLVIYTLLNIYKLKRIKGLSRGQNSDIIKKIAEKYKWNISANNQQISTLNISWENSGGLDWGKQITIIYDKTDILVNCISFGLHSSPSPFHLLANRNKINKLKTEFEREINVLQHGV